MGKELALYRGVISVIGFALGLGTACTHERTLAPGYSYSVRVVSGNGQSAPAGGLLPLPLRVGVVDVAGQPVRGALIVFRVQQRAGAGATLPDSLAVTDDAGTAETRLRLGSTPGPVEVLAFPRGAEDRGITLRAVATAAPRLDGVLPASVGPGDTLMLAGSGLGGLASIVEIGHARLSPIAGTDAMLRVVIPVCLPDGALDVRVVNGTAATATRTLLSTARRTVLSLGLHEATVIAASELASCVQLPVSDGQEYVLVPQLATEGKSAESLPLRLTAGGVTARATFSALSVTPGNREDAQQEFDRRLREAERGLAPLARGRKQERPPMLALTLGSLRTFDVVADLKGESFSPATGRLRFLGRHVGVFVDTMAEASLTDDQLASLGRLFDGDLYTSDVDAFGVESDIDANQHVLVFFTPRVNALVPTNDCAVKGFVSGFFYGRDLVESLPHSNGGEVFYAIVPDVAGKYGCLHGPGEVMRVLPGVFVHEFQHMISFFHHALARGGEAEATWLNEGLSHVAEELASRIFERRYPAPLGRSSTTQLFPDSSASFISPQMLNAFLYLVNPAVYSVTTFAGAGTLQERGAAWLFLRWLGDQKGEEIFKQLVQTSLTGTANIEARAGESLVGLFGAFSLAIYADSLPGVPRDAVARRLRFTSRNVRRLMAREAEIQGFTEPFPIVPVRVPLAGYAEGPLVPGTMVYGVMGSFPSGTAGVALDLFRTDQVRFTASDGAQLGILRVR